MREQPPPPCNPHRPGTPATPPAPTALWSGTGSASFNLPCCATSFLRPHDPCPYLNDRRAAPPWWGSVAALPRLFVPAARATDSHVEVPGTMTTAPKFRRKNSCPDGWLNAGAKVPIRLTVRQEEYCRQAIDIHRFCYNLAVRTHRFCRRNRLLWPSWMDISKAFNACKRVDYPFVTQVSAIVATGAFRDFGRAVDNWRNPSLRARAPRTKRRRSPAPVPSWRPAA